MKKLKIAITGGIGSGKSTVCEYLKKLNYQVISADAVYNEMLNDNCFVKDICSLLSIEPLINNDKITLDKKLVSEIVFNDKQKLEKLNKFTHQKIYNKLNEIYSKSNGIVFFEIPLLFEDDMQGEFDYVIIVSRDVDKRVESVALRDNLTKQQVNDRIKNQFNYDNLDKNTHNIIYNNGDLVSLYKNIDECLEKII